MQQEVTPEPKLKAPELRTLAQRRKRLDEIASDPSISYSDRADARRLIETAELYPREFGRDFADLNARVQQKEENQ